MLRNKYLIWWMVPIVLGLGLLYDYTSPKFNMVFSLSYFTAVIAAILFGMGFVYFFLRKVGLKKNGFQQIMLDICTAYSVFFSFFFPLCFFSERFGHRDINDLLEYASFAFLIVQVIVLLLFMVELFKYFKNTKNKGAAAID